MRTARVYLLEGDVTAEELERIKKYVINPVEAREAPLETVDTLQVDYPVPADVEVLEGFLELDEEGLKDFIAKRGLAMDEADIAFCQQYFRYENRVPTITEIKMIDTYWSDHCRHTTFGTILEEVRIEDVQVKKAFDSYLAMRKAVYAGRKKDMCLMDLATIGGKYLKAIGKLKNLDESDEINACTVKIKCDVDGEEQDWLYLFRPTTTPPRSSPSAARPPASAAPSATPCPAAATSTRPCASPARATRWCPWRTPCPANCPSANWSPPPRRVIPATATRSALPPAR